MFRAMRLDKYETDRETAFEILRKAEYGVLSLIGDDGYPYGIPVNHVLLDGSVYFHCAFEGHKADAMKRESRVSFAAVSKAVVRQSDYNTEYASAVVFGRAKAVEGEEKGRAMGALISRYAPGHAASGCGDGLKNTMIVRIDIEHITGKANYDGRP